MAVWRNFLAAILPWFFKGTVDAAKAAANKEDVGAVISKNIDGAFNDPKVIAAEDEVIAETIRKAGKK